MTQTKILDFGYLTLVESWGSDERIIESARQSTSGSFRGWGSSEKPGDERLLRYLWEHKHHTPFEMAGATIEVQAPIFVFREWHRHRTQSYNELSARYTELPDMVYLPSIERLVGAKQATKNKQGSEEGFSVEDAEAIQYELLCLYEDARAVYERLLEWGVAREIARLASTPAQYSRMRASANLRNWLAFLSLRDDPAAQWEIQQYASVLRTELEKLFPRTLELFNETHKTT